MAGSPSLGVARAAGRLEELGGHGHRGQVLAGLAQEDRVRLVQAIDGRAFRAVDLGPLVAEAVAVVALGQRRPFPDPGRPAGELADQARPVVDVRRGARLAVGGPVAGGEPGDGAADPRDRAEQVDGEVDPVDRHVEEVARAGPVLVLPPAPARLGPVEEPLRAEVPRRAQRAAT